MDSLLATDKVYTILELNSTVREAIKNQFPNYIWVCGEIQGLRQQRDKKHTYFELVQKNPQEDSILAKVKVALFAGKKFLIQRRIQEAKNSFELKNDIEVKFLCEVSLHPPTGQYSLIVIDIDTAYTLGKVAQNRLKIIEDLRKRGLLDKNKLQVIPALPLNIGLITAYDSAAYHDFINELKTSGYSFKVLAVNCHMQGKLVEKDVVRALNFFNELTSDEVDLIVITRGGGSIADLSYFDNKKIAEGIANSRFAVISAIGHQIDTTIVDMAAHAFYKTPTKAGQFLAERISNFEDKLDTLEERILKRQKDLISDQLLKLQNLTVQIESSALRWFSLQHQELLGKKINILNAAKTVLIQKKKNLNISFDILNSTLKNIFVNSKDNLKHLEARIKILDPKNILKRGYSITLKGGKPIKYIDDVWENDCIETILYKGSVISKVVKKEKKHE